MSIQGFFAQHYGQRLRPGSDRTPFERLLTDDGLRRLLTNYGRMAATRTSMSGTPLESLDLRIILHKIEELKAEARRRQLPTNIQED